MRERLITARQVAELVGVSPETILRYTRAGELRGIRLPGTARGRLRYRPEDVEAWLEAHETGAADREVLPTRPNRARDGEYASLGFSSLPTPPRNAAKTEEET